MFYLFRAEWIKIVGNRWTTAFLLWIFPVGALAFVVVMSVLIALAPVLMPEDELAQGLGLDEGDWTEQAISVWSFPNSLFGRLVVLAFTAVVFAGEYQWRTFKNVIPHTSRPLLIVTKFLAVAVCVVLTFSLMSLIMAVGTGVMVTLAGGTYGPAITGEVLADFAGNYARQTWLAFMLTLISANFAALAGMVTRSILGGMLVGAAFTYIEGLSVLGLALLAHLLDYPRLVYLYRLTPSYNVANASSWINENRPSTANLDVAFVGELFDFADDLNFSVVILLLWALGLVVLTAYLFDRQDIT